MEGSRRGWRSACAVAAASGALAVGCGGGERQDANEPAGTFKVAVTDASFPERQSIAGSSTMRVTVRNADTRTIPDIAVTITADDAEGGGGFTSRSADAGLSDPTTPLWIVDSEPRGGGTAYVSTWALGPLPAGQTRSFVWRVTPVVAGSHTLRYRVAAGLNGRARAQTPSGDDPSGVFRVMVSRTPPQATVDPKTGDVVTASP
ncbi:hypothetical protein FSW04_23105 [Baekduia soli]|uniref:Uncharacterized protein n=1 Tax=Baekduia soli TaxID=496014 RepID=A0A5B8UAS8_9ACTN|nr:hypothetical protein [Baekduia soli]QEC50180.1 hypothetical protein FSW04_23105 [Baekduia soli]